MKRKTETKTGVMVDNWFMEEMLFPDASGDELSSRAHAKLITAIVLWDKVYFLQNQRSVWTQKNPLLLDILTPIKEQDEDELIEPPLEVNLDKKKYYGSIQKFSAQYSGIVETGALRYLALSAKNQWDYLPCSWREQYLQEQLGRKQFEDLLAKMSAQGFVDREISNQISEMFQRFLGDTGLFIEAPNLAEYIVSQTPPDTDPLKYACDFRKEKPVAEYRKYIERLSKAFRDGKGQEFGYLQALGKEVVNDVLTLGKGEMRGTRIKLAAGITFSKETPWGVIEITISTSGISISWSIDKRTVEKRNLVFLTDLTRYAVTHTHFKD